MTDEFCARRNERRSGTRKTSDGCILPTAEAFIAMKCGGCASLFPPFLLLDEGEVFFDGVLPLLQFIMGSAAVGLTP